ncbi:putative cathepsin B [Monocercomonoides exilis]|uniref:putative cathepsin B n=1 Tax=Monocercomonoides exilis TaxID=2049356 RepID=UPI00355994D7|nr:putative cathepsin B [Monocercomonoides exilis]|eukprot:MONOS_5921.1-p1 / transcript=MONOS_5921.1 / gene=MONOS_5921 / organism=Monocercomonoides_exilis_PA203 / gene_product=cathepsin B / transcript_product=cathepsin B / location=Mono_scaffold00178:98531-99451(+) / protein_length=306 / sequence_SO=supercontig / SO=protein_coding / is_pseudo=false
MFFVLFSLCVAHEWDDIVMQVNKRSDVSWVSGHNKRFEVMSKVQILGLMGAKMPQESPLIPVINEKRVDLPSEYDCQQEYPQCTTIDHVYDQGYCGSCWAMSTFESLQDRFCIHSNGSMTPLLSAQHLVSCGPCNGCFGGWPTTAFSFIQKNGLTTEECIPYQMGICHHHPCDYWKTPKCNRTCYPNTKVPIDKEKYYVKSQARIGSNEESIRTEIMNNGPVTGVFTVYEDFMTYKSGVYHHVSGKQLGLHAIKIVGWGEENGEKYWKVVNSWNTDFGMEGVFFIKRGRNECGIESNIVSGMPRIN